MTTHHPNRLCTAVCGGLGVGRWMPVVALSSTPPRRRLPCGPRLGAPDGAPR